MDLAMAVQVSPTLYDDVFYPGNCYESTHPNLLATLAAFYGMDPTPVERCRVLELGCGVGGNLLPMAYQYPESEFVGVDLSGVTIARGQSNLAALGLKNAKLLHRDIMDVDAELGQFDYIISHGVYSWVPPSVRKKMMRIFKENLSPRGVVYVSYNAHPFSHFRNLARDMMLFHTSHLAGAKEKISQARSIMKFLSEASDAESVHGAVMRDQYNRVTKMKDEVLFHDDLNEITEAFLLHQVVEQARQQGLQYLSDAVFSRRNIAKYPESVRTVLQQFPDEEFMARDQYQDFIDGIGFRRTLLCHDTVSLRRDIDKDFVRRFALFAATEPVDENYCLTDMSEVQFQTSEGTKLRLSQPVLKSAYLCLGRAWPRAMDFDELLVEAGKMLEEAGAALPSKEDELLLVESLCFLAYSGEVSFLQSRPRLTRSVSDRPMASQLARKQSESGLLVTNLLHQTVRLEDETGAAILRLLDGTRNFDGLVADIESKKLFEKNAASTSHAHDVDDIPSRLKRFLGLTAKLGLLVG